MQSLKMDEIHHSLNLMVLSLHFVSVLEPFALFVKVLESVSVFAPSDNEAVVAVVVLVVVVLIE